LAEIGKSLKKQGKGSHEKTRLDAMGASWSNEQDQSNESETENSLLEHKQSELFKERPRAQVIIVPQTSKHLKHYEIIKGRMKLLEAGLGPVCELDQKTQPFQPILSHLDKGWETHPYALDSASWVSDQTASETIDETEEIDEIALPHVSHSPEWRLFIMAELSEQLEKINRTFGEAEENGDCFFDSVAQQLQGLLGRALTKRDIRKAVYEHLKNVNEDANTEAANRYRKLISDDSEYQEICEDVAICSGDHPQKAPVWGNHAIAHMIADIYGVEIHVYASEMISIDAEDTHEGKVYEGFKTCESFTQDESGIHMTTEVCTLIETEDHMIEKIMPFDSKNKKGVIELANVSRDPWGHWMPVKSIIVD
jgi:hypothetical protein